MKQVKLLFLMMTLLVSVAANAQEFFDGDDEFVYQILSENTVSLYNGTPASGDVVIPSKISHNGVDYTVTEIGDYAFYECTTMKSITIPTSITSMGEYAFLHCDNLESVYISDLAAWCNIAFTSTADSNPLCYASHLYVNGEEVKDLVIPDGVQSIGKCAFWFFKGLQSVAIPNSVKEIGEFAFTNCI